VEKRTAPGGRVVSVRLPVEVIERLDRLAETTQRSRGYYLREAIEELLPTMEARYWAHQVDERHQVERRAFGGLMAQLNEPPEAPEG
jgi:predicted DNA-binding protein